MAESSQQSKTSNIQSIIPADLMKTHEGNTAMLVRANEILLETARAVWENEMAFFSQEVERVSKLSVVPNIDADPTEAITEYSEQWQNNSEKMLKRMRTVNDLMLKSSWDLFHLYRQGLQDTTKSLKKPTK